MCTRVDVWVCESVRACACVSVLTRVLADVWLEKEQNERDSRLEMIIQFVPFFANGIRFSARRGFEFVPKSRGSEQLIFFDARLVRAKNKENKRWVSERIY